MLECLKIILQLEIIITCDENVAVEITCLVIMLTLLSVVFIISTSVNVTILMAFYRKQSLRTVGNRWYFLWISGNLTRLVDGIVWILYKLNFCRIYFGCVWGGGQQESLSQGVDPPSLLDKIHTFLKFYFAPKPQWQARVLNIIMICSL